MAPSGNRRPGYSRKAQYGLFFGYVAAVTGAFIALLLLAAAIFDPQGFGALRGLVSDITAPASSSARGAARGVGSIGERIGAYIYAGSKNRALNAEVEENRTRLIEARAIAYENARLKRMLRIVEQRPDAVVAARLVSSSGSSSRRFAILNAGSGNGVAVGMPVRAPEGLIGRVEAVGGSTARIMLLTDGGMVIPVRRADDGLPAISTGTGDGALDIRPLTTGANPFKPGDVLVTSGTGGVYAPNVPVAIITRVADDSATGRPLANPARIDFAIVEPPFQPEATAPAPAPPVAP